MKTLQKPGNVCAKKGAEGVDGITVQELSKYMDENWTRIAQEIRAHTRSENSNLKRNTDKKRSCQYRRLLSQAESAKETYFETKLNRVVPNGMLCGVRGRMKSRPTR